MNQVNPIVRRKNVFDITQVNHGYVLVDNKGNQHELVFCSKKFVITRLNGVEYCFDSKGKQFSTFPKFQLVSPSAVLASIDTTVVCDIIKMVPVKFCFGGEGASFAKTNPCLAYINLTSQQGKEIGCKLGIYRYEWIESNGPDDFGWQKKD